MGNQSNQAHVLDLEQYMGNFANKLNVLISCAQKQKARANDLTQLPNKSLKTNHVYIQSRSLAHRQEGIEGDSQGLIKGKKKQSTSQTAYKRDNLTPIVTAHGRVARPR